MGSLKGTTKSGGRKHTLDKFYTKPEVALQCLERLGDLERFKTIIEPSAGDGSFSNHLIDLSPQVRVLAYDIEPEHESIVQKDWFTYQQERDDKNNKTLVVGNPPFGQQNSLALQFIHHATQFANTVAFIVPLSFMKQSVIDRIDKNYHLKDYWVLPKNSFTLEGDSKNVPCVFQVWEHSETLREVLPHVEPKGFFFCKKDENPDLYLQRVGGRAGSFGTTVADRNENSNYFIKLKSDKQLESFISDLSKLTYQDKEYSVGPRSISKKEILRELYLLDSSFVEVSENSKGTLSSL